MGTRQDCRTREPDSFHARVRTHGTLCASAISAQGVVDDGRVLGMAPMLRFPQLETTTQEGIHWMHGDSLQRAMTEIQAPRSTAHRVLLFRVLLCRRLWGRWIFPIPRLDNQSLQLKCIVRRAIGNGGHGFGTQRCRGCSWGILSGRSVAALLTRGVRAHHGQTGAQTPLEGWIRHRSGRLVGNWRYATQQLRQCKPGMDDMGGTSLATPVVAGL